MGATQHDDNAIGRVKKQRLVIHNRINFLASFVKIKVTTRVFKIIDDGGNRKLDKQEFYWGIKDMGVNISKRKSEILIDHLDTDQDGQVNYDEFLTGIRGMPNELRMAYIDKAFCKFDSDGNGRITAADLAPVYDTSFHPRV